MKISFSFVYKLSDDGRSFTILLDHFGFAITFIHNMKQGVQSPTVAVNVRNICRDSDSGQQLYKAAKSNVHVSIRATKL